MIVIHGCTPWSALMALFVKYNSIGRRYDGSIGTVGLNHCPLEGPKILRAIDSRMEQA
jgi:hypothetical protein